MMRAVRHPGQRVRLAAVTLSLLLPLSFSQPVQADPPVDKSDPPSVDSTDLSALTGGDPSEFLMRDRAGKILPDAGGLNPFAAEILSEAARTLDEASAAGYLSVSPDFSKVDVTEAGRIYVQDHFDEQSAGCYVVTAVSADWLGFHVELESKCTSDEFAERLGIPLPTDLPRDDQGGVATLASYTSPELEPVINASHGVANTCAVQLVSYTASLTGFFLLATSPTGWVYWVSVGAAGAGTWISYLGVMDACFGIHKVMWRAPSGNKYDCGFHSNWNYGYSAHGRWVPFNERWNCP